MTLPSGGGSPTGAAGGDLTGTYPNPTLAAGVVSTTELANGAVTIPKLATTGSPSTSTFLRGDFAWTPLTSVAWDVNGNTLDGS